MKGTDLISAERIRQELEEGFTAGHDDQYRGAELVQAAICYARQAGWVGKRAWQFPKTVEFHGAMPRRAPAGWPRSWDVTWWKPLPNLDGDPCPVVTAEAAIRMLMRAGALIAAEIDRLQRQNAVGAVFSSSAVDE